MATVQELTVTSTLTVGGAAAFSSGVTFAASVAFSSGITALSISLSSALTTTSSATIGGAISASSDITASKGVIVSSNISVIGTITSPSTAGVPIDGTATGNDAPAGFVGEYAETSATFTGGVSMSNGVTRDILERDVTPGDYDAWGVFGFRPSGTCTAYAGSVSSSSTALASGAFLAGMGLSGGFGVVDNTIAVPMRRLNYSSTGTIYLTGQCTFTTGGVTGFGTLQIRRRR